MPKALLVEDDAGARSALATWMEERGFETRCAASLAEARAALLERDFDIVLLDLELPDGRGLELQDLLEERPATEVVFITGYATVDSAVDAFRGGAADYLTKPVDLRRLDQLVRGLLRTLELRRQVGDLRDELRRLGRFGSLVGASPAMQEVYDLVLKVAPTAATVLVTGETGTGKELVAETLHRLGPRAKGPFVPVNCGAFAEGLVESELFGHEKGSFTGADRRHKGLFERAHGGTLFLDEITEMPAELQVRLLRVLEGGSVRRVGGSESRQVDVRVVAATNRDPKRAVADGRLREDLLYRLMVFPIELPPLREREGDVPLLAQHFLEGLNRAAGTTKRWSAEALDALERYRWPGNVRELENAIERSFILAGERIDPEHLAFDRAPRPGEAAETSRSPGSAESSGSPVGKTIAQVERELILATLEKHRGDKRRAARVLGISLKTLYNRLKSYRRS